MRNPAVLFIVLIVAGAVAGCRNTTPSRTAPRPASPRTVEQIRESFARAYPESRVGVVIATRPQDRLIAVGEVKGADFIDNQTVTLIDSEQQVLTTGTIVRRLDNSVHVRYEEPDGGGREPRVGDVMVKTPYGSGKL